MHISEAVDLDNYNNKIKIYTTFYRKVPGFFPYLGEEAAPTAQHKDTTLQQRFL